jgi:hypothetical protein
MFLDLIKVNIMYRGEVVKNLYFFIKLILVQTYPNLSSNIPLPPVTTVLKEFMFNAR